MVIDNINILATEAPDYLRILQNQAKEWADKSILTVVFLASDGASAPPQMRMCTPLVIFIHTSDLNLLGNSSYSRALKYNLGGIPDSDAIKYLEAQGFQHDLAEKVVQRLTGGKLTLLKTVSSNFDCVYEGKPNKCWHFETNAEFAAIQSILFDKVRDDINALLSVAAVPAGAVVTEMLNSPSNTISIDRFEELIRTTVASADTRSTIVILSCSQVITVMDDTVSFQNPAILEYARQHRNRFVQQ